MRERTTWNRTEILKRAAVSKKADPYQMNQDHPNPPANKYENGDPSSWAEDVHSPNEWEKNYSGGETKRDEIGLPELKLASDKALLLKKAQLTVQTARLMLGKKASEALIEDQSVALMSLPDSDLVETFTRLAEQAQTEEQTQEQAPAQEEKQAAPVVSAAEQCMQAMAQGDQEGMKQALQQMVQEAMQQAPAQEQTQQQVQASSKKKAQDDQSQQAQGQEQKQAAPTAPVATAPVAQQDMAAMVQTAVQNALMALQTQQAPMAQEQAPVQQQEVTSEQQMLDEMFAPAPVDPMMNDIEMDPTMMDIGEVDLGPEDEALKMLFANEETEQAQQAQQAQDKQAAVRTASTRTVGTRPSAGVSRVGGLGAQTKVASGNDDINRLASLWSSAPDVKDHFGLK